MGKTVLNPIPIYLPVKNLKIERREVGKKEGRKEERGVGRKK